MLLILGSWTLSREGSVQEYPATVPSTVAGVLKDNGVKVEDKAIFDDPWVYTCTFDLDSKALKKYNLSPSFDKTAPDKRDDIGVRRITRS